MDLSLERPAGDLFVRRVGERSITVMDRELEASFLLAPDRVGPTTGFAADHHCPFWQPAPDSRGTVR